MWLWFGVVCGIAMVAAAGSVVVAALEELREMERRDHDER